MGYYRLDLIEIQVKILSPSFVTEKLDSKNKPDKISPTIILK